MKKPHILLNDVEFKRINQLSVPEDFSYKAELGAWIENKSGNLLFDHPNFGAVASKKKDIEIGEDQN